MPIIYLTLEQAIAIHAKTVEVSGGGSQGPLDTNRLDSVLCHIQNDDYYPTFEAKLTHLFFSVNKFHCFEDGNKRISISLSAQMLLLNGYLRRRLRDFFQQAAITWPSISEAGTASGTDAATWSSISEAG